MEPLFDFHLIPSGKSAEAGETSDVARDESFLNQGWLTTHDCGMQKARCPATSGFLESSGHRDAV